MRIQIQSMRKGWLHLAVGFALVATFAPACVQADDKDVIDDREHLMKTLTEQSAALGEILSGAIPDDNFVAHLDAIALTASIALKAFEPKVLGGEAKPDVWSNWPDFSKRMNEFAQKSADTAKVAREQGKDAAMASLVDMLDCKSCHEDYRVEKK